VPSAPKASSRAPRAARRAVKSPPAKTRPYLRAEDRRRQLIEVAATIAGSEGVERLTIVGLAKAAGVSRQLVYDHFSDLSGLVWAVLLDRFTTIDLAIHEAIHRPREEGAPVDPGAPAMEAARGFLELSREDRHILRSVLTVTDAPAHELNALALQLRERSIGRWNNVLGGGSEARSRARTWALVNAVNGLGDMISTGELDVDEALEEFEYLLRTAFAIPAAKASRRPRRKS
jgi:AcrR family transcriptional regulator